MLARDAERPATLAEDLDIRVAEAVDRLHLVADGAEVAGVDRFEDRKLSPVDVLELVDHHEVKAPRPAAADPLVFEQSPGIELEIVEVEHRPPALDLLVAVAEGREQAVERPHGAGGGQVVGVRNVAGHGQARCALADAAKPVVGAENHLLGVGDPDHREHVEQFFVGIDAGG